MTRKQRRLTLIAAAGLVLVVAGCSISDRAEGLARILQLTNRCCREACRARDAHPAWRTGRARHAGPGDNLSVKFEVTDGNRAIAASPFGSSFDLFREGQGVVAEGTLISPTQFKADSVLAKHDETYMPKEVSDSLKKQGHWKDDYGKPAPPKPAGGS